MSRTKEADLISALYLYASRCWSEGDLPALREMGFGRREIEDLLSLSLVDLQRLCHLNGHPLKVELDAQTFRLIVAHLKRERHGEDTLRALIRADAPLAMMRALFGMGGKDYAGLRQMLDMPSAAGRPPEADEATAHRVWHAWRAVLGDRAPEDLPPEAYLALASETGAPMRVLWNLIARWSEHGGPSAAPTKRDASRAAHREPTAERRDSTASRLAFAADE